MNVMGSHNRLSENKSPLVSAITTCRMGFINLIPFVMEKWKEVEGFKYYEVSNKGRVRSWRDCNEGKREEPRILKAGTTKAGYKLVSFWDNDNKKHHSFNVHRLVAEAFIPNPENKPYVNHSDSDRSNNTVNNLEWVTAKENNTHAMEAGRMDLSGLEDRKGETHGMSKLTREAVIDIKKTARDNGYFYGLKELAEKYDVSTTTIQYVVNGHTWKHVKI